MSQLDQLRVENGRLEERVAQLQRQSAAELANQETRFKNLASEILEANSRKLDAQSRETLSRVVDPLKERIEEFKKKVDETYTSEARERTSMAEQIKQLISLNQAIDRQAGALTSALKGDTRVQGHWGEMVLERILERSGLQKGREFDTQKGADGKRPDVVVYYPGNHCMVVDSKVSLTAYFEMLEAQSPEIQKLAAARHAASVRGHVKELAGKSYQDLAGERTADFVMMFIPNEPAYMAALSSDQELWEWAYAQKVLIVSPTHLVSALQLVGEVWRHDRQMSNAVDIAERAGAMYDKLAGFVDDMLKIEKGINAATDAYASALNKLSRGRGNLLTRAEALKKLGAKTSKALKIEAEVDDEDDMPTLLESNNSTP